VIEPSDVADRLDMVHARIRAAGGDPDRITICAVTKGFGVDAVRAALAVGLSDIGENYAQEMTTKAGNLTDDVPVPAVRWHIIGRVQRNKVRTIAPFVHLWQTVDRIELGREIAARAPGAAVLVQVNVTGETTKAGVAPAGLPRLVEQLRDLGLDVRGLMTVGPTDPASDPRPGFDELARLADAHQLSELSMGMSADLELAVGAGATIVRPGTALFGPRPVGVTGGGGVSE
jgi:PLP dependent protein